ncbi:hypothetical protein FJ366_00320 [Candidatus Dependentiae bacterium]|nr:hypothetical protein [Candidatus Dependentiae bacterium]
MKNLKLQALLLGVLALSATNMLAPRWGKKGSPQTAQPQKRKRWWLLCGGNPREVIPPVVIGISTLLSAIAAGDEEDFVLSSRKTFGTVFKEAAGSFILDVTQSYIAKQSISGITTAEGEYNPTLFNLINSYFTSIFQAIRPEQSSFLSLSADDRLIVIKNIKRLTKSSLRHLHNQIKLLDESMQRDLIPTLISLIEAETESPVNRNMAQMLLKLENPRLAALYLEKAAEAAKEHESPSGSRRGSRVSLDTIRRLSLRPSEDAHVADDNNVGLDLDAIGVGLPAHAMHDLAPVVAQVASDAVGELVVGLIDAAMPDGPAQDLVLGTVAIVAEELADALRTDNNSTE